MSSASATPSPSSSCTLDNGEYTGDRIHAVVDKSRTIATAIDAKILFRFPFDATGPFSNEKLVGGVW